MCDAAAILKLILIMLSLGPTFQIRAPTVALDNSDDGKKDKTHKKEGKQYSLRQNDQVFDLQPVL